MKVIYALLLAVVVMAAYAQTGITTIPVAVNGIGIEYSPVADPMFGAKVAY